MDELTLDVALAMVSSAFAERRQRGFAALACAVLDSGGNVIAVEREDGAGILRVSIATGKAWSALGMGFGTRQLANRAEAMSTFVTSVAALSPGGFVPAPGGVLVRSKDTNAILGAVGISGDTSDRDEQCALAGIAAAGFLGDPGAGS